MKSLFLLVFFVAVASAQTATGPGIKDESLNSIQEVQNEKLGRTDPKKPKSFTTREQPVLPESSKSKPKK